VNSPLANALLHFREANHLSFKQMQAQLNISEPTLLALFHVGATNSTRLLKRLANFFEWTAEELGVVAMWEPPSKPPRRKKRPASE